MPASILATAPQQSVPINGQPGRTLIVGPNQSAGGGYGTIQEAVNAAQQGDTIFVQPGTYDENVTVSTDYVTIIGGQVGRYGWPDLAATTGIALTVDAQGFVCKRMRITSGDTDCIRHIGNGFIYESCVFDGDGQAATEGLVRLRGHATDDSKTASEGLFKDCLFRGNAAGVGLIFDTAPVFVGVGETDVQVIGCHFVGNAQDMTTQDTGTGTYSVQKLLVKDCTFEDKNKANYIDFTTANGGAASDQTGTIMGCYFAADSITAGNEVRIVGTGFTFTGNFSTVGVKDGSGLD